MKIAILYDELSPTLQNEMFTAMMKMYKEAGSDVKILCRGIEGRAGDKYDILRGRDDVFFSEGMPVLLYALVEKKWVPDVTVMVPQDYSLELVL